MTAKGKIQAEAMAKWVNQKYKISKIYSSTLKRASQTAELLSKETGIEIAFKDELMEFNNGLLAGLSREEADRKYPPIPDLPIHKGVYGMESKLEFRYRADYILSTILDENDMESTIAIVSHGGMINQLYHSFLYLPIISNTLFATSDTGIHLWHFDDKNRYVLFSNNTEHYKLIDN